MEWSHFFAKIIIELSHNFTSPILTEPTHGKRLFARTPYQTPIPAILSRIKKAKQRMGGSILANFLF